jgi:hypothetical protein
LLARMRRGSYSMTENKIPETPKHKQSHAQARVRKPRRGRRTDKLSKVEKKRG